LQPNFGDDTLKRMSRLYTEHAGELRKLLAYKDLYLPRPAALVASNHAALWAQAADFVGRNEPVTYIEFGVANGGSIRNIAREFPHPQSLFVGFDSFIGLPEDWLTLQRGTFDNMGKAPVVDDPRIRFVDGWFQNTLHESLSWLQPRLSGRVLIHYDADIYSSTLFLLTSMWPHCPSYFFIMDDFMVDDIVALHDFARSYPVDVEFLARLEGGFPHSVVGKMARKSFSL
jgi:O-methyltransferase